MLNGLEPAMIDHFGAEWTSAGGYTLRPDARRFETWENAYALRLGLGAAIDYALAVGLEEIRERAFGLAQSLRKELASLPGVTVQDIGREQCAIVTFSHDRIEAGAIKQAMSKRGINVSTSSPASTRLDAERRRLPAVVRVSPHYYNTEGELDQFLAALKELL